MGMGYAYASIALSKKMKIDNAVLYTYTIFITQIHSKLKHVSCFCGFCASCYIGLFGCKLEWKSCSNCIKTLNRCKPHDDCSKTFFVTIVVAITVVLCSCPYIMLPTLYELKPPK